MAIDFEQEEKSQRMKFIVPIIILSLALFATTWAYMGKSSDLKKLNTEYRIATLELEKYRNLYISKASNVRGSEQLADQADFQLSQCLRAKTELEDQLSAIELGIEAEAEANR